MLCCALPARLAALPARLAALPQRDHCSKERMPSCDCTYRPALLGALPWLGREFPRSTVPDPSCVLPWGARQTFRMGGKRHRGPLWVQRSRRTTLWALFFGDGCACDVVWHQRNRASKGALGRWHSRRRVPHGITLWRPLADAPLGGLGRPRRPRSRPRRLWLAGSWHCAGRREGHGTHPEHTPEMFAATFGILEFPHSIGFSGRQLGLVS
jgi:hypothetical protein